MSFIDSYNPHLLDGVQHVHFIGCGGSGTYPLIQILHSRGLTISGSDVEETKITKAERAMGVTVYLEHDAAHLGDAQLVVYSAAIHEENPELKAARARGIPAVERSVMLGYVSRMYSHSVCVSGTHGKTTSSSMLTQILIEAGFDPSAVIGGKLPLTGTNGIVGHSEHMVCEACEFCDHFLQLSPDIAVILNVDEDHLEYFKNLDNIKRSFAKFASMATKAVIYNGDDENTCSAVAAAETDGKQLITFGLGEKNNFRAVNITSSREYDSYDLVKDGEKLGKVTLSVPGEHNVYNALAAIAVADILGVPAETIQTGLASFHGTDRRFEYKGEVGGVTIIDDYAHHPTEIEATLHAAKNYPHQKVWCVFQPHTYTRTKALLPEFAKALTLADHVVLADIYAARETDNLGISSQDLQKQIQELGTPCEYFPTFDEIESFLLKSCAHGDLLITMGAGDVVNIGEHLLGK